MSKEQKITNDIKVPNKDLEALRLNFPQCFDKDGNFQLEKFKANLTEKEINFSTESYGLDWLGKSYARLLASDPATTLLRADETHNSKPENVNSENLLIKGDNLEVLKHLANAYYEQVKMIYIDPPYNTGSDGFVYNDDRKFTVKELQNLIGVDAEKAKRILDFTKQKSNSHSAWLTFMYPRLYIAKQLLKDDGVIFVSIDDNEVAQLRLLMDEVFGEENFVADFLWKKKGTTSNVEGAEVSSLVDNTLCYKKSVNGIIKPRVMLKENRKYPLNDVQGDYREVIIEKKDSGGYKRDTMKFEILGHSPREGKRWQIGSDTAKDLEEKNRFVWDGEKIKLKIYDFEDKDTTSARPNLLFECGTTDSAATDLKKYFGIEELFDNPKPIELIAEILRFTCEQEDIILDFFAGSGTTGDAVMQLNAEDSGKRKFILIQIPEPIDPKKNKLAYDYVKDELKAESTIFEITKERLKRAANKIREENIDLPAKSEKIKCEGVNEEHCPACKGEHTLKIDERIAIDLELIDLGFKIYETTPIWEDYNFEVEQFDTSQTLFDAGKLTEEDLKALLVTWKTNDNISLSQELEIVDLVGYTAFYGQGKLYLLHKNFTTENLKAVLEKIDSDKMFNPTSIIAFGYHFESKSLRELSENVKQYANKKKIDIDFITRY
jgi:adenine-specific DNA-methyltransferase